MTAAGSDVGDVQPLQGPSKSSRNGAEAGPQGLSCILRRLAAKNPDASVPKHHRVAETAANAVGTRRPSWVKHHGLRNVAIAFGAKA
mmetsp:Transcript_62257/g.148486  ORF Transcript_62257/g.148486 Transcript_62257/m.148486 type:complete len:87 (-) Transcript_62257:118-378(-)